MGHTTQLDCKVAANPSADVVWFKAEVPVPLDKRVFIKVEGDKNTLFIKNVQVSDFGIYTCRAQNDLGMGELQIQLSGISFILYNCICRVSEFQFFMWGSRKL